MEIWIKCNVCGEKRHETGVKDIGTPKCRKCGGTNIRMVVGSVKTPEWYGK